MPGHRVRSFILLIILALALGVTVSVVSRGGLGDLRSRAWSGVFVNIEKYRRLLQGKGALPPETRTEDTTSSRALFHALTKTYFDAEVQNIDDPVSGVKGVALLKYDAPLDQTVVFSRIERLPLLAGVVVQLWLSKDIGVYQKAGIAEFFTENGTPVAYSVFTRQGDLRTAQNPLGFLR